MVRLVLSILHVFLEFINYNFWNESKIFEKENVNNMEKSRERGRINKISVFGWVKAKETQ